LVRVGVADAMYALQSNANAVGWYDKTVTKALKILGKIHPEINTDPNAKFAFTWALAVTSNGLKVDKNFELAERAYKAYKATGQMPTNIQGGQAQKAINDGLGLFNQMVAQYGIDNVRKFMDSKFAVSQIKRATGLEVTGEFADTQVRGAAVLGPKIGNGFYSNLNGFFDQLTMDRWLMRTWGRWTGTLIESRPDMVKAKRQELRDLVVKMKQNAPAAAEFQKALGAKLTVGNLDELSAAIQKASMDPATREQFNKTPVGEELRKTGNALAKYLDGQKEAPAGPEERNFIRKVFGQILKRCRKRTRSLQCLTCKRCFGIQRSVCMTLQSLTRQPTRKKATRMMRHRTTRTRQPSWRVASASPMPTSSRPLPKRRTIMRAESAQEQQDQALEAKLRLAPPQQFEALLQGKAAASSPRGSSTASDPLAQAMKDNPTLTRAKAEEMARAFGF
jgi:hypothetical protein